jgi:hypothetical protein
MGKPNVCPLIMAFKAPAAPSSGAAIPTKPGEGYIRRCKLSSTTQCSCYGSYAVQGTAAATTSRSGRKYHAEVITSSGEQLHRLLTPYMSSYPMLPPDGWLFMHPQPVAEVHENIRTHRVSYHNRRSLMSPHSNLQPQFKSCKERITFLHLYRSQAPVIGCSDKICDIIPQL